MSWFGRPRASPKWPMFARLLEDDARAMDTRRAVIGAIHLLNQTERAQLLLYLLGDDWAALDVIDQGKWRFQEHLGQRTDTAWAPVPQTSDSSRPVSEGEGLR